MKIFGKRFYGGLIFMTPAALLLFVCIMTGCTDTTSTVDIEPAETDTTADTEPVDTAVTVDIEFAETDSKDIGTAITDAESAKTTFTKEELLADYDALWEMLEEDYLYFPLLERQGVNVESLKTFTRQQLEDRIVDFNGFYYLLNNMFGKLQFFAHLSVVDPEILGVYQKYFATDGALRNGWQRTLQNPQTQAIYAYLKSTSKDTTKMSDDVANSYHEADASYDAERKAVTFVVTSFDDALLERDRNFISDYLTSLGNVEIEHIIFDISGNAGGNDLYWKNNIVAPFGGTYEWSNYLYLRDTELTRKYFFDDFDPQPVSSVIDHTLPSFVQELALTHVIQDRYQLTNDAVLGENALTAKRWVIIDGYVYSSADSFSAFCKATGWATLVGQTTLGDGQGVSPVLIVLPNTGLLVRFSALAAETPDGTLNAITGIAPDIPVNPQLTTARDVINRLIDGE